MAKVGDYPIPFDTRSGDQLHYAYAGQKFVEWCDNAPFEDELTYAGYDRGRSAAYFSFTRKNGAAVTVFMKELEGMIPHMVRGKVAGVFQFTKRGENYGARLVRPADG